ncbi:hypothetical protein BKA56DRAFT_623888 [Ilyonectria sp. MPI-CAGE-AT-0026]|nr:hypothetical protein BKA56DRAFT_623888 [Ilyonectria sp. MPI-CAGE-AT-0026]
MARRKYTTIGDGERLTDKSNGSMKSITKWKRLKSFLPKSSTQSAAYIPVRTCEFIQPAENHMADDMAEPVSDSKEDNNKAKNQSGTSANPISIVFTHNQPCREFGEDEDFRCLWLSSSEEEDVDDGMNEDEISVSSWPRPV